MSTKRYARISSANDDNQARKAIEIPWCASRGFAGVRCALALSDSPTFNDPDNPDWTYLDEVINLCVENDLELILQIGGEGPPKAATGWKALNGGTEWDYNRRPALGTNNAVVIACARIKQAAIDRARDAYLAVNKNPVDYLKIQIGNEPGLGGSGASSVPDPYGTATGDGYWDGPLEVTADATGCSYLEFLELEIDRLNFWGCEVIAPCFEAVDVANELLTFGAQNTRWMRKVTAWSINLYRNLQNNIGRGLGPKEAARVIVRGKDGKGLDSTDTDCFLYKINLLRQNATIGTGRLYVTETGLTPTFAAMTASGRSTNYAELGRMRLAVLDELAASGELIGVTLYNVSNTTSDAADNYGVFTDDVGTGLLTCTTADFPFARRSAISELELLTPYTGEAYVTASGENLPYVPGQGIWEWWTLTPGQTPYVGEAQGITLTTTGTVLSDTGKLGTCIKTSGSATDSYVGLDNQPAGTFIPSPQGSLYISAWVKVTASTADTYSYPFGITTEIPSYIRLLLDYDGALKFIGEYSLSDNPQTITWSGTVSLNTWYFVELAYGIEGNVYLAVNGAPWQTDTALGLSWGNGLEQLHLAENGVLASGETVLVDQVQILNHVPDSGYRAALYNGGSGVLPSSLAGYSV